MCLVNERALKLELTGSGEFLGEFIHMFFSSKSVGNCVSSSTVVFGSCALFPLALLRYILPQSVLRDKQPTILQVRPFLHHCLPAKILCHSFSRRQETSDSIVHGNFKIHIFQY